MVQDFCWEHWRSVAVQTVSEPEICQGAGFKLRADARVRVQVFVGFVLGAVCRKNHDKPINYTVRVRLRFFLLSWDLLFFEPILYTNIGIKTIIMIVAEICQ
jgi:hypothetical protein